MSEVCVKIELDDQGQVTVGQEPSEDYQAPAHGTAEDEQAEAAYMKPAKSIDDALATAKQLLEQGSAQTQPTQDQAESQFAQGFKSQQPGGAPAPNGSAASY